MNDVRRFMRYILPGLACAIELLIALIFSIDININELKNFDYIGIGAVFGVFLASGAMGYILSIIYFGIVWFTPNCIFATDHRSVFAILKDKIQLINEHEHDINSDNLTKRDAWTISSLYWCHNKEKKQIKGIDPYIDLLLDIYHGLGAFLIGTYLSLISWSLINLFNIDKSYGVIYYIIIHALWLILLYLIWVNYKNARNGADELVKSTLLSSLLEDYNKGNEEPVRIIFTSKKPNHLFQVSHQ